MDKHIDGFRGFLGYYFGKNARLYMQTSGIVFYWSVLLLGLGGSVFGIVYYMQNVVFK